MHLPRQARQGLAVLSVIAVPAICLTVPPLGARAGPPVSTERGDDLRPDSQAGRHLPENAPPPPPKTVSAPPAERETAEDRRSTASTAARNRIFHQLLVRERTPALLLSTAAAAMESRRPHDAVPALQAVLDSPHDVFIWTAEDAPPVSARRRAAKLMHKLPAAILAEYERRYGAEARQLWNEFERTRHSAPLRELLLRFEATQAGAEALRWAGMNAFDQGRFAEAAQYLERWLTHPATESARDGPAVVAAAVSCALAAESGIDVHGPRGDARVRLGSRVATAEEWQREFLQRLGTAGTEESDTEWRLAFGSPRGHRRCAGGVPSKDPLWSAPHNEQVGTDQEGILTVAYRPTLEAKDVLAHWMAARRERRMPCAASSFALVDGERVLVRDFAGIAARDLYSGDVLWRFATAAALDQHAADVLSGASAPASGDTANASAQLFEELYAANSVLGMLSSDGQRVYFVDAAPPTEDEAAEPSAGEASNRLVALALDLPGVNAGDVVWQLGPADAARYYLGPPLPTGGRLLVIAEQESLVSLVALEAATGRTLWVQPISLVDASVQNDPQRARQACCPMMADGVVICPTQLGMLVAADAETGTLLWAYAYAEMHGPSQPWRGTRSFEREFGRPEYPNLPLLAGGTVILLAPQSSSVHCVELQSGRCRWKQPREQAQYAALAGDDLLLLVGLRECVARRLSDGTELWRTSIDAPAGRGVTSGDVFLLPCADGRIRSLNVRTGQLTEDLLPQLDTGADEVEPAGGDGEQGVEPGDTLAARSGNLIVSGDLLISCSAGGISVYPQAGEVLLRLRRNVPAAARTATQWLELGELELRIGDRDAARQSLTAALTLNPAPQTRAIAERRLRDLYYAELEKSGDVAPVLRALDRLCVEPEDRSRYFVQRLLCELRRGDLPAVFKTAREMEALAVGHPVEMDAEGTYEVVPVRRAACAISRMLRSDPAAGAAILEQLADEQTAVVHGPRCFWSLSELSGWSPRAWAARRRHTAELIADGQLHQAELILLQDLRHRHPEVSAWAARELATLWDRSGLAREAARLRDRNGATGSGATGTGAEPEIVGAEIRQQLCEGDCTADGAPCHCRRMEQLLERNREFDRHAGGTRVLLDRGLDGHPERFSNLSIVDVSVPRVIADLEPLPPRVWRSGDGDRYDAGHFLPLVSGDVHGVSLLEGRIVWSTPPEHHRTGSKPLVGPYGPEFCILQSHETVTALDPRDGRMIWRRTDLPFDCGLVHDENTGMFGDDVALVIFDSDRVTFRVLDPRSGELLRTGQLQPAADPRRRGWTFGRRLLFITPGPNARVRIWEPLADSLEFDEPLERRCLVDAGLGPDLAVLLNGRRLTILKVDGSEVVWQSELTDESARKIRQLRAVEAGDHYLIHLEQEVPNSRTSQAAEIDLPCLPIGGTLFAIERRGGRHWSREVSRCNLLLLPSERLKVFVTAGRTRDSHTDAGGSLTVEVLDAANGQTLARRDDLVRRNTKPLIHAGWDSERRSLALMGVGSRIDIRLITSAADP